MTNEQSPQPGDMVLGTPHRPRPVIKSIAGQPRAGDIVLGFMPSVYQKAIFDWLANGDGSCVVPAVPGSGKTTTLIKGISHIPKNLKSKFLAFNQHIVKELNSKLPKHIKASTIHSLGLASINRKFRGASPEISDYKYTGIIQAYLKERKLLNNSKTRASQLKRLVKFAQLSLIDFTQIESLQWLDRHYNLGISQDWRFYRDAVSEILERGITQAREVISYEDMIWLPCYCDFSVGGYDFLFVDEAQDLNRAQLEFVLKAQKSGSRGIYVGDGHQAIMGFSGSDDRSIPHIIERTKALQLPLSICYRCPVSHIELANKIHNVIEPRPNAPQGKVSKIKIDDINETVKAKDLIICRCLYPLVSIYYSLLQQGIPAEIKNKDMGRTLISLLEEVTGEVDIEYTKGQFTDLLQSWYGEKKREMEEQKTPTMIIVNLHERILTLNSIYSYNDCVSTGELSVAIDKISKSTNNAACVYLTTVHGAKGLEAERVFIVRPDLMPHPKAEEEWELEQEWNLKFVALTRAKQELFFCSN